MMNAIREKARAFIYRNARQLDFARWRYHFEGGSPEAVVCALSAYQNPDGGFGHGLEADFLNPESSPIQTWSATMVLREIGLHDPEHPVVSGLIRYLESGRDFDGHCWASVIPSNNDYPHAPWWSWTGPAKSAVRNYNPTASLAGYLLRAAAPESPAGMLARRIAQEAYEYCMSGTAEPEMHLTPCFLGLCREAEIAAPGLFDVQRMREKLCVDALDCLNRDAKRWEGGYCAKPSDFISGREDPLYPSFAALAERECAFIADSQLPSGAWPVTWQWADYPEDFAVSANRWQSHLILKNLLFLRGMGRI